MATQNSNLHVVYDGTQWAIAVEGVGRIECSLDFIKAITIATSLAIERQVLLYVHDKQGCIDRRMDFSTLASLKPEATGTTIPTTSKAACESICMRESDRRREAGTTWAKALAAAEQEAPLSSPARSE